VGRAAGSSSGSGKDRRGPRATRRTWIARLRIRSPRLWARPTDISQVPRGAGFGGDLRLDGREMPRGPGVVWAIYTPASTPDPTWRRCSGGARFPCDVDYTANRRRDRRLTGKLNGYSAGRLCPAGVAAMLYSAVGMLYYEGRITSEQRDRRNVGFRNVLNLTGPRPFGMGGPWPRGRAERSRSYVDEGRTGGGFVGRHRHLSPQDLVELLRGKPRQRSSLEPRKCRGGEDYRHPGKSANCHGANGAPTGR